MISEFSSKIKKVCIELHNYSFFHSPSEIGSTDKRFIGREKIKERLKAIILNSESKSGAYLITGYRGMGKSSFVSKAVDEVSSCHKSNSRIERLLRLIVILYIVSIFDPYGWNIWSQILLVAFCIGFYIGLYLLNSRRKNIDRYKPSFTTEKEKKKHKLYNTVKEHWSKYFPDSIKIKQGPEPKRRANKILQDAYLIILIHLTGLLTGYCLDAIFKGENKTHSFYFYIGILSIISILDLIKSLKSSEYKCYRNKSKIFEFDYVLMLKDKILGYFNNDRRINIKINLGSSKLKEIDIFRLVTTNLERKYAEFLKFSKRNCIWKTVSAGGLILLALIFSGALRGDDKTTTSHYFYYFNEGVKQKLRVELFFPSQFKHILNSDSCFADSIKMHNVSLKSGSISQDSNSTNILMMAIKELQIGDSLNYKSYISRLLKFENNLCKRDSEYFKTLKTEVHDAQYSEIVFGVLAATDLIIYSAYKFITSHAPFNLLPQSLNYIFVFYLVFFSIVYRYIFRFRLLGIVTHKYIIQRIKHLNEIMSAQVTSEQFSEVSGSKSFFRFNRRKITKYPIAGSKDIEKYLLEIFDDIDKIPRHTLQPEFIFIFDELDKIQPRSNVTIKEKEEELFESSQNYLPYYTPTNTRDRQKAVQNLFSNLKYFLSTAKAKFIFIAGREMYDAALADVSDRNFFIGSIFHDVIYVPSFLTDTNNYNFTDITNLTEQYVCQFLFPEEYKVKLKEYNLKEYNQYLLTYDEFNEEKQKNDFLKIVARQKREKVIFLLQRFITYLTHRSTGAPKKLTALFENFINTLDQASLKIKSKDGLLLIGNNNTNLFLTFDYFDQYTIGMMNYMVNPLILAVSNSHRQYGDKLLVSVSFLIDHLFKFHRFGFSWRNIEITPEIIDVNKTPELRGFITNVIHHLSQIHIDEIVSGLYQFKFPKKISEEIMFLSKVSEKASAAFNFTLDESQAIKQHYREILKNLHERYAKICSGNGTKDYIHSIAAVHMILGDLHFYDEEYGEALTEYKESLQYLKRVDLEKRSISHLLLLIRNMLKMGLTFEKKRTYNSAFMTYAELTQIIMNFREIDLHSLNLEAVYENNETLLVKKGDAKDGFPREIEMATAKYLRKSVAIQELLSVEESTFTPFKDSLFHKLSAIESLRLLHQPIVANLQIKEKSSLNGITRVDLKRAECEFDYLVKLVDKKEKYLVRSEFYKKLANVVYYKNGLVYYKKFSCENYKDNFEQGTSGNDEQLLPGNLGYRVPCTACYYYNKSLDNLIDNYLMQTDSQESLLKKTTIANFGYLNDEKAKDKGIDKPKEKNRDYFNRLVLICISLEKRDYASQNSNSFKALAKLLSDIGDTFLSCSTKKDELKPEVLELYFEHLNSKYKQIKESLCNISNFKISKFESILYYYYFSAVFYKKANKYKDYSLQLVKILYLLREYLSNKNIENLPPMFLVTLKESIVEKAIGGIYDAYENSHRQEIEKMQNIFTPSDKSIINQYISLSKVSVNVEIKEINILFKEIELKVLGLNTDSDRLIKTFINNQISPYNLNDSIFNRILELSYKAQLNYKIFSKICGKPNLIYHDFYIFLSYLNNMIDESKINKNEFINKFFCQFRSVKDNNIPQSYKQKDLMELFEHLITDSIFCLNEIVKIYNLSGQSFMLNHSFLGTVHEWLMVWSGLYNNYEKIDNTMRHYVKQTDENDDAINEILITQKIMPVNQNFSNFINGIIKENGITKYDYKSQQKDYIDQIGIYLNSIGKSNRVGEINSLYKLIEDIKSGLKTKKHEDIKTKFDEIRGLYKKELKKVFENLSPLKLDLKAEKILAIKDNLGNLIEYDNLPAISVHYQCSKAIKRFRSAIETHTEGQAYKDFIDKMYYFNDDYNDKMYHFMSALERYKINSLKIRTKIDKLKQEARKSTVYKHELYVKTYLEKMTV